jgi:hypothetical protein
LCGTATISVDTVNTLVDDNNNVIVSGEELGAFTMWISQGND